MRTSDTVVPGASARRRGRHRKNRPWRDGGASTARWGWDLLGWAALAVGAGSLGARALAALLPSADAATAAQAVIWTSFAAPVVWAWSRSRPRGLLHFRGVDLLYGLVFGVAVRLVDGTIVSGDGTPAPWPATPTIEGTLPDGFAGEAFASIVVAPALEEAFFRGVVLVCAYTVARRLAGKVAAGVAATAISSALFVAAHLLASSATGSDAATLAIVGVVTSALVLGTGRLWPAVAVHVVFNATGVVLLAVGTLWA